jgi:hypothetical protein
MKQIAIRKHFSYFTTTSSEINGCVFDEKIEKFDEEFHELLKKYGFTSLAHETRFIPIEKMSLCYCEKCNELMVNRDKNPTRFDRDEFYNDLAYIILDGGIHEGKELCQECLPVTHRWGLFS